MGLRPTNSDEKHAQRRRPGERSVAPGVFFRGAVMRGKWTGYFVTGPYFKVGFLFRRSEDQGLCGAGNR